MFVCSIQVVEDGYEFFAKRQLVTLFSAPNYCGDYDNAGGMMTVDEELMCSFQVQFCRCNTGACQCNCGTGTLWWRFVCVTGTAHACMHARRYILIVVMLVLLCADFEALGEEGQVSVHWSELWEAAS